MSILDGLADLSSRAWPLVADHLWQATLFSALAFGAAALLGRGPARAREYLWLMASLKVAVPSFVLISLAGVAGLDRPMIPGAVAPAGLAAIPLAIDRVAAPFAGPQRPAPDGVPARDPLRHAWTALTLTWAAGALVAAASWRRRRRRLSRALAPGTTLTAGREIAILGRAARRAGATLPIRLLVSDAIDQPGVHGMARPVVVLPEGLAARLTDAELEAVFVHELVHVRRHDNLIGTLHMALCCLFWFYPVVWLLDRRLLVERERVCDDEVLRLSGTPGIYASSLLKVCRFCLGARVAGVSAAAGTGMRDRVARIVAHRTRSGFTSAQRALVGASGAAFAVFVVAGLAGAHRASALDSARPPAPGARDAGTPRATGAPDVRVAPERVAAAPPVPIAFENAEGAPVVIGAASVRIVPLDSGDRLVTPPALRLRNTSGRRVEFVRVGFGSLSRWSDTVGFQVGIAPDEDYVLEPDWRSWSNIGRAGEIGTLVARIVEVRFDRGDGWSSPAGDVRAPRAPRAATAPGAAGAPPAAAAPARFENPTGAPVIIVDALTDRSPTAHTGTSRLPVVTLANTTDRRVTHLKLRFKADSPAHAVSAFAADIAPDGTYVFRSDAVVDGDPTRMHVQLLGVRFEDGLVWGAFDTTIDTREPTVSVPQYIHRPDQ